MPFQLETLRTLLPHAISEGAFADCTETERRALSQLASMRADAVDSSDGHGYQTGARLLRWENDAGLYGIVVKEGGGTFGPAVAKEHAALKEMEQSTVCRLPRFLGQIMTSETKLFISELIPGIPLTQVEITKELARSTGLAIRTLQEQLSRSNTCGDLMTIPRLPDCEEVLGRFLNNRLGLAIREDELSCLAPLTRLRRQQHAIVSDRSPANFLVHEGRLAALDFGLLLPGSALEDWSWFIDDPRLMTQMSRFELFTIFQGAYEGHAMTQGSDLWGAFQAASLFVTLKQTCLMHQLGNTELASGYLERAGIAAEVCMNPSAVKLVKKISLSFSVKMRSKS